MTSAAEFIKPTPSWTRLDGVDLLRGLAIFFVLMNHVNMQLLGAKVLYTKGLPAQLVYSLVWNGQFGVQIFFAVSGFLITSTTLKRWGSPARVNLREFYQLRFARIAPLLLILLAILSGLHLVHIRGFVVSQKDGGLGRVNEGSGGFSPDEAPLTGTELMHVPVIPSHRGLEHVVPTCSISTKLY
jgi:peptidoglycan/LPS O-acetylase OafA/YrhL